jgi:hypothetical protein
MSYTPLGIVCEKCKSVIGTVITPDPQQLVNLGLKFACPGCVTAASARINVKIDSADNWEKVISELKGPPRRF